MDLEDLMIRLQAGGIGALEEIYHATKRAVYVSVFSLLRHKEAAEDIMQDTYLRLTEKISKYKPNGTPQAWICAIARNLAMNYLKKNRRFVSIETIPERETAEDEDFDVLALAVKVLNNKEFEGLYLKIAGGFTHKEIAEMTKTPQDTVRWRYHSAIEKLKTFFKEESENV